MKVFLVSLILLAYVVTNACGSKKHKCLKPCPKIYHPVCGSNWRTYSNQCLLDIARCKSGGRIRKKHIGVCNKWCPYKKNPCSRIKCRRHRKCVPDFASCSYSCQPRKCPAIACLVPACFSNPCKKGQKCLSVCPSGCFAACLVNRCGRRCGKSRQPVCGTDNRTYQNQCQLNIQSCKTQGKIRMKHSGRCCNSFCIQLFKPVCGSDGMTYSNSCFLGIASCKSGGRIRFVKDGKCH